MQMQFPNDLHSVRRVTVFLSPCTVLVKKIIVITTNICYITILLLVYRLLRTQQLLCIVYYSLVYLCIRLSHDFLIPRKSCSRYGEIRARSYKYTNNTKLTIIHLYIGTTHYILLLQNEHAYYTIHDKCLTINDVYNSFTGHFRRLSPLHILRSVAV